MFSVETLRLWAAVLPLSLTFAAIAQPALSQPAVADTEAVVIDTDSYALGPGDKLRIVVFNEENLSGNYAVSSSGDIAYPLIGPLPVNGLTVSATRELIRSKLDDGYVIAPDVTVEVTSYRPYFIYGEVVRSGEYPFVAGLTLQQAIATAGGYSYRAAKRYVLLRRSGETTETKRKLNEVPPIRVMPGDTIRIGERHF